MTPSHNGCRAWPEGKLPDTAQIPPPGGGARVAPDNHNAPGGAPLTGEEPASDDPTPTDTRPGEHPTTDTADRCDPGLEPGGQRDAPSTPGHHHRTVSCSTPDLTPHPTALSSLSG